MGFSGGVGKSQHALGTRHSTCRIVEITIIMEKKIYFKQSQLLTTVFKI